MKTNETALTIANPAALNMKKAKQALVALMTAMYCMYLRTKFAFATFSNPDNISINTGANPDEIGGRIVGFILVAVRIGGSVVAVFGVVKLIQAFNDDNAQAKLQGGIMLVSGLGLVFLKNVLQGIGLI